MKKAPAVVLILVLVAAFLIWKRGLFGTHIHLSTPEIMGGVVRTDGETGGRLYYLTSQWEKRIFRTSSRSSSSTRTEGRLNIDLWELDAATAQPVVRRRIKQAKVNGDAKAMGMEQGILWARIPELIGIRLSDGEIVADATKIEARNPTLAGLMPKPAQAGTFLTESMQPLKFSPQTGMIVRLDDARLVRIDPLTLEATPHKESQDSSKAGPETFGSKVVSISNGMDWWAMVRGLAIQAPAEGKNGQWLGLLAETDLAMMQERHVISPQMDFSTPRRQKLHRAELKTVQEFLGAQLTFENPSVLAESPEFLMAGLLTQGSGGTNGQSAMYRREPDSVFVLSRDRLGEQGRLQLARISGPKGTPVWATALPLSDMGAWLPGERYAVMLGPDPSAQHSPMAEEGENTVPQVIAIDLKSGEVKSFNPDLHRDWPVQVSGTTKP
ncbi:PA2928 family protein [Haloferula sp. BvORR071]|uniref:PA2928 family protein n=1 Tax=Haloferula sp. BvORR071 TaxID=1396141 RepID=UPI002240EA76|nr:PA2928 family protein [Haloferula sp. BvORR071]